MDTIKDRNIKDITESERLRSSGKNTQNYTKKVLMTWMWSHNGVITHLETDILECEKSGP